MRLSTILWGAFVALAAYVLGRFARRRKGFALVSSFEPGRRTRERTRFFITAEQGHLHWTKAKDKALLLARREDADQLCEIVEDAERIIEVKL